MRIGVIGIGSIGSVNADGFSQLGHRVYVNDTDAEKTAASRFEVRSKEWLKNSTDLCIVTVPTPTTSDGGDISYVDSVLSDISGGRTTVVIRSTMPPGTTSVLAEKHNEPLVYYPEFLRDRSGVDDFFHPDRIVLAGPEDERSEIKRVMSDTRIDCETIIETDDYLTAEIAKEGHNAFFATKVSFANQIRMIAEAEGADPRTIMDIICADRRNTTSHLDPTLGAYGGSCLPKDTLALAQYGFDEGVPVDLLEGTVQMNEEAKQRYEYKDIAGQWPNIKTVTTDGSGQDD